MKKKMLFLPFVAAMVFVGCSQNEEFAGPDSSAGDSMKNYLTVNLVAAPNMGTRAEPTGNDQYEDGAMTENAVNSVRFYFFDATGNAATVKSDDGKSYYDWKVENDKNEGANKPNVEKTLAATLIIQSSEGDKAPASVVAVINPPAGIEDKNVSLDELNNIIQDFGDATTFVMSNSVYAKNGLVEPVSVTDKIHPTTAAALAAPVDIYVERVLAKVRLGVKDNLKFETIKGNDGSFDIYKTSADGTEQFDKQEIYVRFLGWNVTATAKTSRLMKSINTDWNENLFGNEEPWNYAPYFRSFWAINPDGLQYAYGSFNKENMDKDENPQQADALPIVSFSSASKPVTYVQENAAKDTDGNDTDTKTKVIIAAQLVDEEGVPMTIAEWAGMKYSVVGLKNKILAAVSLWKDKTTGGGREQITPNDIEFKTATEVGKADENRPGRYKVYAQLTKEAAALTWYASGEESDKTPIKDVNELLIAAGPAKIWNEGYTYYYFDIKHLGSGGFGEYGVVRNHLYDANITSIAGLGTPVYDPGETIYPEKPADDEYIAAEIKVLSWRFVPNEVELEW